MGTQYSPWTLYFEFEVWPWWLFNRNIVVCREGTRDGPAPETLRSAGTERIVGRRILRWSAYLGTYGFGGLGFFGLQLDASETAPEEWLALRVSGAGEWLLLDGVQIEGDDPRIERDRRALYIGQSNINPIAVDRLSDKLIGFTLESAEVTARSSRMRLRRGDETHVLELSSDWRTRPRYPRQNAPRLWHRWEHMADAWVLSPSGTLWT